MRTRWLFNDSQPLDLFNIHLFHDASNLVAMKATPSPYAQTRQTALEYALRRIAVPLKVIDSINNNTYHHSDDQVPLFIFGDFNFRLDTNRVIQKITEGVSPIVRKSSNNDEVLEFVYHRKTTSDTAKSSCDCSNQTITRKDNGSESIAANLNSKKDDDNRNYIGDCGVVMTVGKKLFDCENWDEMFRAAKNTEWLLKLDNEWNSLKMSCTNLGYRSARVIPSRKTRLEVTHIWKLGVHLGAIGYCLGRQLHYIRQESRQWCTCTIRIISNSTK